MKTLVECQKDKREFVATLVAPLKKAVDFVANVEYLIGSEIIERFGMPKFVSIHDNDEYVVITCQNSYRYYVNVTGNSKIAIVLDVAELLVSK